METILNNKKLISHNDITSLMLYGYACFTSFIYEKNGVKGFKKHIKRLEDDTKFLFNIKVDIKDVIKNIKTFLKNNSINNSIMRVTIFPDEFLIGSPNDIKKLNILITGKEYIYNKNNNKNLSLFTYNELRSFPLHKTVNLTVNLKARSCARTNNFDDALLVYNNKILETATANIFFYKNKILYTPKKNILLGTTRNILIDYFKKNNLKIEECNISISELNNFDGCFITNAIIGAQNITQINQINFKGDEMFIHTIQEIYSNVQQEQF